MGASCTINTYVRNKEGQVVESKLWNDLMDFTRNNRSLTQQYYAIGTNQSFLQKFRHRIKYDENGQITLESLKKIAKLKGSEDAVLAKVRGSFRASDLTFEQAFEVVLKRF